MHPFKNDGNNFHVIVLHIYLDVCMNERTACKSRNCIYTVGSYKVEVSYDFIPFGGGLSDPTVL